MTADTSHGIARSYGFRVAIERCRDGFSCARCLGGYQLDYGEAESRALPKLFGCKERLKYLF